VFKKNKESKIIVAWPCGCGKFGKFIYNATGELTAPEPAVKASVGLFF
jgi:hypothetical protein